MSPIADLFLVGLRNRWRCRKTIRQLSALSDHALRDIGLDRSEIRSLAKDLGAKRNASRMRIARSAIPGGAPINATDSSTDTIVQRLAA